MKFGSAVAPVYEGNVRGNTRFTVAYYSDGFRIRQTFRSLEAAISEARVAAGKIQNDLAKAVDLSVADRDTYRAALAHLAALQTPLLCAVEEYARCRKLLGDAPLLPAVDERRWVERNACARR